MFLNITSIMEYKSLFSEFSHASFKCNLNNHTFKNLLCGAPSDFENIGVGNLSLNPCGFTLLKFFCGGSGGKTLIRGEINFCLDHKPRPCHVCRPHITSEGRPTILRISVELTQIYHHLIHSFRPVSNWLSAQPPIKVQRAPLE